MISEAVGNKQFPYFNATFQHIRIVFYGLFYLANIQLQNTFLTEGCIVQIYPNGTVWYTVQYILWNNDSGFSIQKYDKPGY